MSFPIEAYRDHLAAGKTHSEAVRLFGDGIASTIDEDAMFNAEFDRLQAIRECERRMCLPDPEVVDSIRREGGV